MRDFLRTTGVYLLLAFIGETVIAPLIDIQGIAPNFSVIALIILALSAGAGPASVGGFVVGLIQGLTNPSLLGLQALCKTLVGYGVGSLRGRLVHGVPLVEGTMVTLAVLSHDFIYLLFQSRLIDEAFLVPLITRSLPAALYSGVVGVLMLRLVELVGLLRQED
jgi:rod shape-determining protein MreD|nr:rod shape-determining protein MreD [Candidatus Krumholzibacteria bacterium]